MHAKPGAPGPRSSGAVLIFFRRIPATLCSAGKAMSAEPRNALREIIKKHLGSQRHTYLSADDGAVFSPANHFASSVGRAVFTIVILGIHVQSRERRYAFVFQHCIEGTKNTFLMALWHLMEWDGFGCHAFLNLASTLLFGFATACFFSHN
jgi:hypothetical protein